MLRLSETGGYECYVITPIANTGYRGRYPFEIIDFFSMSLPRMGQYRAGFPLFDAHYQARIEMVDLDIVHVHSPFNTGQAGLRVARRRNLPLIATLPFQIL